MSQVSSISQTNKRTKNNEWYTPGKFIEAARAVMGGIDLDPASTPLANETVRASNFFTEEDNGLQQCWYGRVWLNPPFERRQTRGRKTNQGIWINRLVKEYESGNVQQAILLTTCRPDTEWFEQLWRYPICFARKKVGFYTPEAGQILQEVSRAHGTLFVYLGPDNERFKAVFGRFGHITPADISAPTKLTTCDLWEVGA